MRRASIIALGLLACAPFASAAQAQSTAVLLPALADPGVSHDVRGEALAAAAEALRASGYTLRSLPEDMIPGLQGCDEPACVAEAREATGAALVVQVRLFGRATERTPELVITFFTDPSGAFTGRARVGEGGMGPAAARALEGAERERLQGAGGPSLVVSGTPEGASVYLDDTLIGRVHYHDRVEPGAYTLRVTAPGHRSEQRTLRIPAVPGHVEQVSIALEPEGANGGASMAWAVPVGIPTVLVGLALGILPGAVAAAEAGCTERDLGGNCLTASEADIGASLGWGLAGLLLVGGGIGLIAIGLSDDANTGTTTTLHFGPTGLSLEGTF